MADNKREKDAAILALAEANRLPCEEIWSAETDQPGMLKIRFIETLKVAEAKRMMQIGLAGGEGRYITCEQVDGV